MCKEKHRRLDRRMRYGKVLTDGGLRGIKEDVTSRSNVWFCYFFFVIKYFVDILRRRLKNIYLLSEGNGYSAFLFKMQVIYFGMKSIHPGFLVMRE